MSLNPLQFLLIVPVTVWVLMPKNIPADLPSFCPAPQMVSVYLWVIFYCSLESSQDNQGSLKLEYTGSSIFVIKVSDRVLNYENDCKVISELSNEACSHSVGLSYFQWYPINMWYVFVPLLQKGNYEGGKYEERLSQKSKVVCRMHSIKLILVTKLPIMLG